MIRPGIKGERESAVTPDKTAKAMGSGELAVYATPAMVALIEETARESVAPYLEKGTGTVGTRIDVRHVSPTPAGMKIRCESELVRVENRKLVFRAVVYDETGIIGEGEHERFIIQNERFMQKAASKQKR